jgi:hypothetical protein
MVSYIINTTSANTLTANEELVYGGKNGFITTLGAIPILCNSFVSNVNSVVFSLPNLHLLQDDNYNTHILDVLALESINNYQVRVAINQFPISTIQEGSVGFTTQISNVTLALQTYNLQANTITVENKPYGDSLISDIFLNTPFYVTLYQTLSTNNFSNLTTYITGSRRNVRKISNVVDFVGSYIATIGTVPRSKNDIKVYLDDILTETFEWANNEITVNLNGTSTQLKTIVQYYTVPAIEPKDLVSLSQFANTYTVINTSYSLENAFFNSELTSNNFYKIKLDKPFNSNVGGLQLLNISSDLVGIATNISDTSFVVQGPADYPYTYNLANNSIYYLYQKNKVKFTTARVDEYGRLLNIDPTKYVVEATNVNRYNRTSSSVKTLLDVIPLNISKVGNISIEETIFVDTTGGASINITVTFPTIKGRDITGYELNYRIDTAEGNPLPGGTVFLPHDESQDTLSYTISNVSRGRTAGVNTLVISVTPLLNLFKGFPTRVLHPIIGRQAVPSGIRNLNIVQQGETLLYSWQFQQTTEGLVLDLDTKEVEIRRYPGLLDVASESTLLAAWGLSISVAKVAFPNTSYSSPVTSFGNFTYLLRVRNSSEVESDEISAIALSILRPSNIRVIRAYNDSNPGVSFIIQDNLPFPTSNVYPELPFSSFSEGINGGLVLSDSSNTDNANGSAVGFSVFGNTGSLSTDTNFKSTYYTPIRDMGEIVQGTVRINPLLGVGSPGITYSSYYESIVSGISDFHPSTGRSVTANVLVDNAFGGLGTILGFNNANAATVSYNSFHRTLTSGGNLGNVYAIRNPGQFTNDEANANSYALIAAVLDANAILLGEVYFANGNPSGANNFNNVTVSGNSYQLINFYQYGDIQGTDTFAGGDKSIIQNVFVRFATSNVYYLAEANGVVGYPGHGNTNANAFAGAVNNAEFGWKNYIPGLSEFRYMQIQLELINPTPNINELLLEELQYEVDVPQKTIRQRVQITSVEGVTVNYAFANFYEIPEISAIVVDSADSLFAQISDITRTSCNVKVFNSQNGSPSDTATVSVLAVGG